MRSASEPVNLHIANYLRLADRDLKDAHLLQTDGSRNASYHLEQAAEKVLLALLTSEHVHVEIKDTHRLDVLADKLPGDHPLRANLGQLAFLSTYATAFRYPKTAGRLPPPLPPERFSPSAAALRQLIDRVARHFGVDLAAGERVPADNVGPMRTS